ncbi:MAG TPA: hypothetical protein EYG92_10035 [Lutibacter sp.]|nr:hypothetical protein [Lutibacter sp.]
MLNENKVRERLIASYKLYKPIIFRNREIDVIEIPQPSNHNNYTDGWQHVEFVIDESFRGFIKRHPNVNFATDGLQKKINPELKVEWEDCVVKFNHQSLEYIATGLEE